MQVTDTPGVCDTHRTEMEVLREVGKSLAVAAPGPHVVLMVLRCDRRFTQAGHCIHSPSSDPEGRPGVSDVSPLFHLSRISGLSFDSTLLSPLLFFLTSPVTLSVFPFFCLLTHSPELIPENFSIFFVKR